MARKEEVLASTCLSNVLPVLSWGAIEVLAADLERAAKNLGSKRDNGLRQLALAVRSFHQEVKTREERLDAELTIDCR